MHRHDRKRNEAYVLGVGGAGLQRLAELYMPHPFRCDRKDEKGWHQDGWTDGQNTYVAVRDVHTSHYQGFVYNLSVEEDNSYVAEDIAVHNCWVDCDEQLLEQANMPKYLRQNIYTGYAVQQHHISIDALAAMKRDVPVRLYRNIPGMRFYGLVHEHAELGINKGIGTNVMVIGDVHIHHDGYLIESIRRNRFKRNLRLLQCDRKKYPERLLGWFLYEIRDCQHMARYAMEQNGGIVNDEVRQLCQTTVNAYRDKFMKENMMMSEDAMNYYSNALAILGLGIDISADIEIGKNGSPVPPQKTQAKFRAMDASEAVEMLKTKINAAAQMHSGRYVQ